MYVDFVWRKARKGYVWVEDSSYVEVKCPEDCEPQSLILAVGGTGEFDEGYYPLRNHTGLFRTFADTPTTCVGIRSFANQYGHLGTVDETFSDYLWDIDEGLPRARYEREYAKMVEFASAHLKFSTWASYVSEMKVCVKLFDRTLKRPNDQKAMGALAARVNELLAEAMPRIQFVPQAGRLRPDYQFIPGDLWSAMVLQLADAITNKKSMRSCSCCRRWFAIAPDAFRKSKRTCSDACRAKLYRLRKRSGVADV